MANMRINLTQDYDCTGRDSSGKSVVADAEDTSNPKVNVGERISKRGRSPSSNPGRPHKSPCMQSESTTQMDGDPEACMEGTAAAAPIEFPVKVNVGERISKRGRSPSSSPGRPHKSPCMQSESTTQMDGDPEACMEGTSAAAPIEFPVKIHGAPDTSCRELGSVDTQGENLEGILPIETPAARRKSLRRSTIGRRSLPAFLNPIQSICRSISPSLPQQERLEKIMKASMELAIENTHDSLKSTPGTSLETFQKQVEDMQKEWCRLAKNIHDKMQYQKIPSSTASDPVVEQNMEHTRQAISRLQLESESWERLLNKHRSKAAELTRKVEEGQVGGVVLDSTSVVRSSQYQLIQSKPDYRDILRQQLPRLQTMEMVMDSQRKMARDLLSAHDRAQTLVTETSRRLREEAEAGFQNQSCDNIRHLLMPTKDPPLIK